MEKITLLPPQKKITVFIEWLSLIIRYFIDKQEEL